MSSFNTRDQRRKCAYTQGVSCGALCVTLLVLFLGCAKKKEDYAPAGSSSLTKADAALIASSYARVHKANWSYVAASGSMAPIIDSRSVLLLEPYTGQPLFPGDIVCFDRGDNPNVCHRIVELNENAFYVSGDNNLWPDGWFPLKTIKYRVAGIIYTQR